MIINEVPRDLVIAERPVKQPSAIIYGMAH